MDHLQPNDALNLDDQLLSNNGKYRLVQQRDGNLVLYRVHDGHPLWASGTSNKPVTVTVMQADGNLVAYSRELHAFWSSKTFGHPNAYLQLQDDGNLVVYDSSNRPLWSTNTWERPEQPHMIKVNEHEFIFPPKSNGSVWTGYNLQGHLEYRVAQLSSGVVGQAALEAYWVRIGFFPWQWGSLSGIGNISGMNTVEIPSGPRAELRMRNNSNDGIVLYIQEKGDVKPQISI